MTPSQIDELLKAAHDSSARAYAPYSNYSVGAAVLCKGGELITGSNVENASYGLSLCAETIAITSANNAGKMRDIVAIGIAGGPPAKNKPNKAILSANPVTPCGRCRQIIKEVADITDVDIDIYSLHESGYTHYTISQLLPDAFGPNNISRT